jgi:hypothetical protein
MWSERNIGATFRNDRAAHCFVRLELAKHTRGEEMTGSVDRLTLGDGGAAAVFVGALSRRER